jgi:hypothetical protein
MLFILHFDDNYVMITLLYVFVSCIIVVKGTYLNLEDKYKINFHIAMMLFLHFKCVNIISHLAFIKI